MLMWIFFKVCVGFIRMLLLIHVLVFWLGDMLGFSSVTRIELASLWTSPGSQRHEFLYCV